MAREVGDDGCPLFRATIGLSGASAHRALEWGVNLTIEGRVVWAIPTEVKDTASTRQTRVFTFSGNPQQETYYLTHCRRLGSNLRYSANRSKPGIQFAVWAPNARSVELVLGCIYDSADQHQTVPQQHIDVNRLSGGFISDRGDGIEPSTAPILLSRKADGIWMTDPDAPAFADFSVWDHQPYMYRVVRDDGSTVLRTDLYSRCQVGGGAHAPDPNVPYLGPLKDLEGRVSCSAVINPETVVRDFKEEPALFPEVNFVPAADFWADEWTDHEIPTRIEDLIIYELHLGALGFGSPDPGTLADAIGLLGHLNDLGINAVELLPLSEFGGGAQNWGYSTSHYFAIEYAGGGRDKFKHFIKACHRLGIAVLMDIVFNHYDQEADRAERYFDSPAPQRDIYYWYEGVPEQYLYPRGGYLDNQSTGDAPAYHEEMVRKLFISSAVALMREFHVDGFRVDQTTSIHSYNRRIADGTEIPAANIFGAKLLRELGRTLRLIKPGILLIAEDHSTWDQVTAPIEIGGMGFDARWFSDFYHHLVGDTDRGPDTAKLIWVAAAMAYSHPPLAIDYFANQLSLSGQAKVVYNESHDEAGNSRGPFRDPDWNPNDRDKQFTSERTLVVAANGAPLVGATRDYAEARCRWAYGITVLSAGTPMFLFGEEVGAVRRFKYNAVLENKENYLAMRTGIGANLFNFYAAVNRLRLKWPGLRSRNIDVVYVHNENRVIAFRRWEGAEHYLVVASLSDTPYREGYYLHSPRLWDGQWSEVFNSDSEHYGGASIGNMGAALRISGGAFAPVVPANGLIVFQRVAD